jgi:lipopolysaccharide/colanic/teichoic acid biosynthesis glycosyltransferase
MSLPRQQLEQQQARIRAAIAARGSSLPWRTQRVARSIKRVVDVAVAAPVTVAALPVMAGVALAVRMTSKGPVLLKQERVGLDGELFTMWKFRSMRADRVDGAAKGAGEVTRNDPRLTPIGGVLRDWRLDELPQLFQVLNGQMSLVGPRPDLPGNLPAYTDEHLVRFAMPPGCTAWTLTRGLFDNDWATRQAINAEYVEKWSVLLDLEILVESIGVIVGQRSTAPKTSEIPRGAVHDAGEKQKVGA